MKFTWKEIVKKSGLNIPMSTANFYRDKFIDYYQFGGEGRHRKYAETAIEVLVTVSEQYKQGNTTEAIREALELKYGLPADLVVNNSSTATTQQVQLIETIREVFREELRVRDEAILRLEGKLNDVLNDNKSHDEKLCELIRLQQQRRQQDNQSFWKKIFTKK